MARRTRPDVVLMDIRMPRMNGIEATGLVTPPGCRMLLLTTYDLDESVYRGLRAGAGGFLLEDVAPADLVRAVHVIAELVVLSTTTGARFIALEQTGHEVFPRSFVRRDRPAEGARPVNPTSPWLPSTARRGRAEPREKRVVLHRSATVSPTP